VEGCSALDFRVSATGGEKAKLFGSSNGQAQPVRLRRRENPRSFKKKFLNCPGNLQLNLPQKSESKLSRFLGKRSLNFMGALFLIFLLPNRPPVFGKLGRRREKAK
jgi:hypothetical protein